MHELLGPDTVQQISSVLNFEHTNNTTELTLTKLCCVLNIKLMLKHLINYLPMYSNSSLFGVTPHHLTQICKSTASLKQHTDSSVCTLGNWQINAREIVFPLNTTLYHYIYAQFTTWEAESADRKIPEFLDVSSVLPGCELHDQSWTQRQTPQVLNIHTRSCYSCLTKQSGFYTWHFHGLHILVLSFVSLNWSIMGMQKTYRKQKLFCIVFRLLLWNSSATSLQMWNGTWWGRSVSRLVFTHSFSKEESGN